MIPRVCDALELERLGVGHGDAAEAQLRVVVCTPRRRRAVPLVRETLIVARHTAHDVDGGAAREPTQATSVDAAPHQRPADETHTVGGHTPGVRVALGYKGAVENLVATLVVVQVPSEVQVYAVLVHQRLNVGLQLVRTEDVAVIVVVCDTGTGTGTMVVRRRRYSLAWLVPHTHRSSSKSRTSAAVHRAVAIHDDPLLLQQPNAVSWCKDSHTRRRLKL